MISHPNMNALSRAVFMIAFLLVANSDDLQAAIIVSHSSTVDDITGDVQFQIEFDSPPDFLTFDFAGRQADSFQYYIFYEGDGHQGQGVANAVIRGEEIHLSDAVRIRDRIP